MEGDTPWLHHRRLHLGIRSAGFWNAIFLIGDGGAQQSPGFLIVLENALAATVIWIHAKYYGWRYVLYLSGLLYVCMVAAGITVH